MTHRISDDDLIHMYTRQGRGYTDQELADYFNVGREAIFKRRQKLETKYPFKQTERGRYRIDTNSIISHIPVKPAEALILYAFLRRSGRSTPFPKSHVKEALHKLAPALYKPMAEKLAQAAAETLAHPDDAKREDTLKKLLLAWTEKRAIRVKYQALQRRDDPIWHIVSPYLIEPSPWSDSIYLIGYSTTTETILPLSLERIEKAVETSEPFKECDPETEDKLLRHAWGIWGSNKKPQTVRLHFTGYRAVRRLRESVWHPDEEITGPDDCSYAIWQAPIAEPREMLPWIRGWGADVEALEPEELRKAIKTHVWKLAQIYNLTTQNTDTSARLLRLWGKTSKDPNMFHPALYHMFDVAHTAQQLLSHRASPRWRQVLAQALNAPAESLHEWLPYLIALHDIGKISVPFQILNDKQDSRLKDEGFTLGKTSKKDGYDLHHSIVGRIVLKEIDTADWPENLKAAFEEMVSGHHGIFQCDEWHHQRDFKLVNESEEWPQFRQEAINILQSYLLQQWPDPLPNPANQSTAIMALNGFCILCDWLGSDGAYFTPAPLTPLTEYLSLSRKQAFKRVHDAGFFEQAITTAPTQFEALFNFAPRPLQSAIDTIPNSLLKQPTLTIIEAPTGEGKTEAALALARRIGALRGADEMYIALPTTATSNAMYDRIEEHLVQRLDLPKALVRLVHGQDFLKEDDLPTDPLDSVEPDNRTQSPAPDWFGPKKRALLAPIGVGTIDQAELSALNVRHNALRMIGLAGKTIILDEVHAYDTYMTTIIKRMLTWLASLGSSVILLSATLPQAKRQELADAFAGQPVEGLDLAAYPSLLTIGAEGRHLCNPNAYQPGKSLHLHFTEFSPDKDAAQEKAKWLLKQVENGGCVCWMNNTVKRTQQIYSALLKQAPADVELHILHARFPLNERQRRETAIMNAFGKNGQRPKKGIVVGTQVLEQSLDLDFDVMITDLAPIDLILQRAGRLHRHQREASVRASHQNPHLYINTVIDKTSDTRIYAEYILQKSLQILEAKEAFLSLPDDYRPLIEAVYHEGEPPADDPLYELWDNMDTKQIKLTGEADLRLTNPPDPEEPFYLDLKPRDFKEDEDSNGWLVAQTRWSDGRESATLIPLLRAGDMARSLSGKDAIPLNQKAPRETQLNLLRQSVRISRPDLIQEIRDSAAPPDKLFSDSALLKNCLPLWLVPNAEGEGYISEATFPMPVHLDNELGLVIGEI